MDKIRWPCSYEITTRCGESYVLWRDAAGHELSLPEIEDALNATAPAINTQDAPAEVARLVKIRARWDDVEQAVEGKPVDLVYLDAIDDVRYLLAEIARLHGGVRENG